MKLQDYDAYLFDWDGTLAQSHEAWLAFYHEQLKSFGITLSDEEVVSRIFGRAKTGFQELGLSESDLEKVEAATIRTAKEQMTLVDLYPGATSVLELLDAKGKKIALVTASFREVVDLAVANHNLLDLFDVVITGDEVKAQKPDPDGIITVLQKLNVAPNKAIMIGDSPKDLLAGNNAGTDTLLFYPPEHETQHPLAELQKCSPTYTIRAWQELLDRLQ